MARDRKFQAILPLRGKILNVERRDDASLYKNNEIASLIIGLGLGLKGETLAGLRYGKVGPFWRSTRAYWRNNDANIIGDHRPVLEMCWIECVLRG